MGKEKEAGNGPNFYVPRKNYSLFWRNDDIAKFSDARIAADDDYDGDDFGGR